MTPQPNSVPSATPSGLSSAEALKLRAEFGPNSTDDSKEHPALSILRHFWSPVPWMLEATIILQVLVGERLEALMIAILLLANVGLGVFQETRANAALELLKQRLVPRVRLRRDGVWTDAVPADLVPGDIVHLSLGGIVPADLRLLSGSIQLDQSMLTGESVPIDAEPGALAYAGAMVRRGEAIGTVAATGARTFFGRAAELVRTAHVESGEQKAVIAVVRLLTIVNAGIVLAMVAYAYLLGLDAPHIVPLVLTALLSAVPVALPATFSLAAAVGARLLAKEGVLLARLQSLNEAAMIDVLCVDKTGTLTENALAIAALRPIQARMTEARLLALAAAASSPHGQDPIDTAIRNAAKPDAGLVVGRFTPFDPAAKMAEAQVTDTGGEIRVVKGSALAVGVVAPLNASATVALDGFSAAGYRTLVIAAGPSGAMEVVGLIAFSDPPRADSKALLAELRGLGVRVVMITGDAAATAANVASAIGLQGPICPPGKIPDRAEPADFAVYAGVFPEDKFKLVQAFQHTGHTVGMCGDGANDAPALRQAQMGIAVSTATDVAKAAAGIVLTAPGLSGIVTSISEGRSAFQRVMTYTLSMLINKCATLVVLGVGLVMTGGAVMTPMLQALWMLAGDLVTMARAADHAKPSPYPNVWRVGHLALAAIPLGATKLAYCVGVLAIGWYGLHLSADQMRSLTFLTLVLAGQANMYVLRTRGRFWRSLPVPVMLIASGANIAIVTSLVLGGVLMTALAPAIVAMLFAATLAFALLFDQIKLLVFARIRID